MTTTLYKKLKVKKRIVFYKKSMIHEGEMQKNQCLPKTFKKLYFGSGPPSPKHQRLTFFLDIEHWTRSLRVVQSQSYVFDQVHDIMTKISL